MLPYRNKDLEKKYVDDGDDDDDDDADDDDGDDKSRKRSRAGKNNDFKLK